MVEVGRFLVEMQFTRFLESRFYLFRRRLPITNFGAVVVLEELAIVASAARELRIHEMLDLLSTTSRNGTS